MSWRPLKPSSVYSLCFKKEFDLIYMPATKRRFLGKGYFPLVFKCETIIFPIFLIFYLIINLILYWHQRFHMNSVCFRKSGRAAFFPR